MAMPIVGKGTIKIETEDGEKIINITRAHLEEDAGKSIHDLLKEKLVLILIERGHPFLK